MVVHDNGLQSAFADIDGHTEDEHTVVGRNFVNSVEKGGRTRRSTRRREKHRVFVVVPPVPESWKRGGILRIDTLNDDVDKITKPKLMVLVNLIAEFEADFEALAT